MSYTLPLDKMTIEEKLSAMEAIWTDLCRVPESVPSPAWHEQALNEIEESLRNGQVEVQDWEEAKRRLRESR